MRRRAARNLFSDASLFEMQSQGLAHAQITRATARQAHLALIYPVSCCARVCVFDAFYARATFPLGPRVARARSFGTRKTVSCARQISHFFAEKMPRREREHAT